MSDSYIAASIHPFVLGQEIYVVKDGERIKTIETTLDQMKDMIFELSKEYDINDIDFFGGQLYALKFKDELAATKYAVRPLNIRIH